MVEIEPRPDGRLRRVASNLTRFGIVAVVTIPIVSSLDIVLRGGLLGMGTSPVEQFLEWTALSAPYVIALGFAAASLIIALIEIVRPSRRASILLSVTVGPLAFAGLVAVPSPDGLSVFSRAALESIPLWMLFGWIARLPRSPSAA